MRWLCILNSSYLQRELGAFVFFSKYHRNQQTRFNAPDLRVMFRVGDVELSDESHQERLYLDDPAQKLVFNVPEGD